MSVIVTAVMKVDPEAIHGLLVSKREVFENVAVEAKAGGALHHRIAVGDGEVLIVDEWESEDAFSRFFDSHPAIVAMMQEAGAQEPPTIRVWKPMPDEPDLF